MNVDKIYGRSYQITILLNCALREIKQRSSVWGREDERERER